MGNDKRTEFFLWAMLTVLLLAVGLMAAVPPVSRDALTHHLAIPKLYLQSGSIYEIPEIVFSYYPMNLDLLYLIPLYFGNDILPKYIHFVFGLLTAALIYRFLVERTGRRPWGLLGVLLFLSVPVIVKLSITVYVDLGLVFFSTAALLYILKWALHSHQLRHLCLAGVFCGLCLGTKYNGLITFFLLTCAIPILYLRGRLEPDGAAPVDREQGGAARGGDLRGRLSFDALRAATKFVVIAVAVFSPWMIRNICWTGNPVYPLYKNSFKPATQDAGGPLSALRGINGVAEDNRKSLSHFVIRKRVFGETLLEAASTPIRVFFQGEDDNPKYFDGRLNPYLLIFPVLAFWGSGTLSKRRRLENLTLAGFAVLYLLYVFFERDMRIRYIAPIIPPLVILAVLGLDNAIRISRSRWPGSRSNFASVAAAFVTSGLLLMNGGYVWQQFKEVDPLAYISGKVDRETYITKRRDEYPAFQFINRYLPAEAIVLSLYLGKRVYYSDRRMYSGDDLFEDVVSASGTVHQISEALKSRGFTHLFIRNDFFDRFLMAPLDDAARRKLEQFFDAHTVLLFGEGNFRVLALS